MRKGGDAVKYARKEMTSAEQLVELRKARDRYKALADQFRDGSDPLAAMEERLKREQDARRIANAYEKSIANIVARSTLMRQAHVSGPTMGSLGAKIAVLGLFVMAIGASLVAIERPALYQRALAFMPNGAAFFNRFIAASPSKVRSTASPAAIVAPPEPDVKEQRALTVQQAPPQIETVRPQPRPEIENKAAAIKKPAPVTSDEGGFVAKALQPDGTLKEQYFTAKPHH